MENSTRLFVTGILAFSFVTACEHTSAREHPQDAFMARLQSLCGQAFPGKVVSTPVVYGDFDREVPIMHVRDCEKDVVRIPVHVGENRSRTWVVTRTDTGLRLKHDHRRKDGSEDALTQYGGDTIEEGTNSRQEFPIDTYSKELLLDKAINDNIWGLETDGETLFAYELRRPNHFFRIEFDLTAPVSIPPPAWGAATP